MARKKILTSAQNGKGTKSGPYDYGRKKGTLGSFLKGVDDLIQNVTFGQIDKADWYKNLKDDVKRGMRKSPVTGEVAPEVGTDPRRYSVPRKSGGEPKASDYIGNPLGYYNDKAKYGREQARKKIIK